MSVNCVHVVWLVTYMWIFSPADWEPFKTDMNTYSNFVTTITTMHIETYIRSSTCFNTLALNHHRVSSILWMGSIHLMFNVSIDGVPFNKFDIFSSVLDLDAIKEKKICNFSNNKSKICIKERISLNSITICFRWLENPLYCR